MRKLCIFIVSLIVLGLALATPQEDDKKRLFGGGGRVERNFYRDWVASTRLPKIDTFLVKDARVEKVYPWPEIGGLGLYVNFPGNVHMDTHIYEIPAGSSLKAHSHMYEELIYVLSGRGYSVVQQEGRRQEKVEWSEGDLFSPPLNVKHQHFNADDARPARLLAITTLPYMMQVTGNYDFLFEGRFAFRDRYDAEEGYFKMARPLRPRWVKANLVRDLRRTRVELWEERGKGNASMFWEMSGNVILEPHVSEFPVGSYKLGHRHPYEAIIYILNGRGFSLFWKEKGDKPQRLDWQEGSVISPPYYWYHQHFNAGKEPARYLAITEGDFPKRLGIPLEGDQIEAADEDPAIRRMFEEELRKSGVSPIRE